MELVMFSIVTLVPFATGSVEVVNTYGSWLFVIGVVAIELVGVTIEVVGVDALVVDERVVILKTPAVGVGDAGQTKS